MPFPSCLSSFLICSLPTDFELLKQYLFLIFNYIYV